MSSACPQAAKSLFAESKRRLSDRVAVNVNNCASVARQIARGDFVLKKYFVFKNSNLFRLKITRHFDASS